MLESTKESLERQIEGVERDLRSGLKEVHLKFDVQGTRLGRQAALIQTGSRWTNRMNAWSEKSDVNNEKVLNELKELRERVRKLEERNPPAA